MSILTRLLCGKPSEVVPSFPFTPLPPHLPPLPSPSSPTHTTTTGEDKVWNAQLDVRDLGGHLDFTRRARAGTLSNRVKEATLGVAVVGALPLGFQVKLGLVRGKYLPAAGWSCWGRSCFSYHLGSIPYDA